MLPQLFSTTAFGQVAIPLSQINLGLYQNITGRIHVIEGIGERLFIGTREGLWIVEKDGKKFSRVESVKASVKDIEAVGERIFVGTTDNLLVVSTNDGEAKRVKDIVDVFRVKTVGDQVFVGTSKGLWIVSANGEEAQRVNEIEDRVYDIEGAGELSFVGTNKGLWMVSTNDGAPRRVEGIEDVIRRVKTVDEQIFVGTREGLWIVGTDGIVQKKVAVIKGPVSDILTFGEQIFVSAEKLWIVSTDGTVQKEVTSIKGPVLDIKSAGANIFFIASDQIFRLDPVVTIKSRLVPSGWWATVIGYVLPSNWLPSEKVQATAFYADEKGVDPYDKTIPKEFRFAKADDDEVPSDNKFSTQEIFNYEIGWGKNEVRYWVKDKWGNTFEQKAVYRGVPSQYFFAVLPFIFSAILVLACFALAPRVDFCHSAIMNPWLRKYFSLGSVPLLLSVFPSLRRHILQRYSNSMNKDKEFTEWKKRFVCPDEEFLPENFGKKLESERRLLLTGQSGIGKTSFFKHLTAHYVSQDRPPLPAKVFPVYIPLTNYGGNSLEDLVYNQLFAYGKITDKELAPMFLEQGGILIFLDGVNEVQDVADRQKLSEFVEKFWTSNYICLSSQQSYPEIENIPKVKLITFSREKVCEFIRERVNDKKNAEEVIKSLTDEDYQLYGVPRDLEFAIEILNGGEKSLPRSRTELYKTTFSSIFAKWKEHHNVDAADTLCEHAYTMIVQRDLAFDSVDNPRFNEITTDLVEQKFLVRREKSFNFRHDLIRSYLASEYFYPRWKNLFEGIKDKQIDSNWLEMLKFSCENIEDSGEVKSLVHEVLKKSVRKDLVKNLFEWLKANHPSKCRSWEKAFYARYGELDFK
jgi:GTPase SAR1 family protein